MANKNKRTRHQPTVLFGDDAQTKVLPSNQVSDPVQKDKSKRFWSGWGSGGRIGAVAVCLFLAVGAFGAGMKYLEDTARQQKTSIGDSSSVRGASLLNSINPFVEAPPLPTPTATPQLSKEYIYAGSRMLAVEDANATAVPPADLAVWRPSTGWWYVLSGQGSQATSFQWGDPTDKTVPGDYDGDGKTDFSVFRPGNGTWYVSNSSNGYTIELTYGLASDVPAPADYDGDGRTDMGVFRPSAGYWHITYSSTQSSVSQSLGLSSDIPAPADYDGDGRADLAVWRPSNGTFYIIRSSNGQLQIGQHGQSGDEPVPGDYDGDGRADYAVRRGANWFVIQSSDNQSLTYTWGNQSYDLAVPNDYDADGKLDIAVWRKQNSTSGANDVGNWFIRQSSLGGQIRQVQWGTTGDTPVPAFYRR